MVNLTREETKAFVEKLMVLGRGDPGRLNHILIVLTEGRELYNSDKTYLDEKFSQEIGLQKKIEVEENTLDKIQKLITSGIGDTGRLQFILESLKQGKTLYRSDRQYLESKLGQTVNYEKLKEQKSTSDSLVDTLRIEVLSANQKIANLESIISKNVGELQASHKSHNTLPRGWQAQAPSLEQIERDLASEQDKINHKKTESEKIQIEQSKLTQIILDREEFEKQVKAEKHHLQSQIEQERQKIKEQNELVDQIRAQELELEQAKKQRDVITAQLQQEQFEIASQADNERRKLVEQARAAKKLEEEKAQLESIRLENQKIIKETKAQELALEEQLEQEKAKLESQASILKSIQSYEKYIVDSKQKQIKLTEQINEHKQKIQLIDPKISQIKSDKAILDMLFSNRTALEKQVKEAQTDLKSIKKEKMVIEKQIKAEQVKISREKKKEQTKIKQLEKKKKAIFDAVNSEHDLIKKRNRKKDN